MGTCVNLDQLTRVMCGPRRLVLTQVPCTARHSTCCYCLLCWDSSVWLNKEIMSPRTICDDI